MPYEVTPSLSFTDLPGALPGDVVPSDVDLDQFSQQAKEVLEDFREGSLTNDALWRDFFAFTGRVRTFYGDKSIAQEWKSRASARPPSDFQTQPARVSRLTQNSSWVDVVFKFTVEQESGLVGECFGILSFVPDGDGWRVWMLRTMLECFYGHGHPDNPSPIFNSPPVSSLKLENEYEVVIIGAGQSGLSLAGRLGALGIKYLLLEKAAEVGYSWTGKYDSVRQHTVKEMNNLPFDRTYKGDDPILLPARTVAEGFKGYVEKYKINIWLSAQTEKAVRREDGIWMLSVKVGGKILQVRTRHLVLSMGAGVSVPNPPKVPGREKFNGDVLHQAMYKNAQTWKSKRGVVVGSGTTAHDIAQDMLDSGLTSITMIQRDKTPIYPVEWIVHALSMVYNTDIPPSLADRLVSLIPLKIERELMKANIDPLIAAESARFDAVEKSGFRVDRNAVLTDLLLLRGGGYYIDVGTSKRIADGEIKVKSGVKIEKFTENGLKFEDGKEIEADLVIFATGYERDARKQVATIVGDEVARGLPWYRGLDGEGEIRGDMRPSMEGMWIMGGSVNQARFQSRFVALQIQADLLGKPLPDCQRSGKFMQDRHAPFNPYDRQHEPTCLPNTRVDVLQNILRWADGEDQQCFWLNGLAGTGKLTIAHTVARKFFEKKWLEASFLFTKDGGDVGHAGKFVTSVAVQLVNSVPTLRRYIRDAVTERSDITSQSLLANGTSLSSVRYRS